MNFIYYRIGNYYLAINQKDDTVYTCCNTNDLVMAKKEVSIRDQDQIIKNNIKVEITEEEFQKQFSAAVEKLQNETPFA